MSVFYVASAITLKHTIVGIINTSSIARVVCSIAFMPPYIRVAPTLRRNIQRSAIPEVVTV